MSTKLELGILETALETDVEQLGRDINEMEEKLENLKFLKNFSLFFIKELIEQLKKSESSKINISISDNNRVIGEKVDLIIGYLEKQGFEDLKTKITDGEKVGLVPPIILNISFNTSNAIKEATDKVKVLLER